MTRDELIDAMFERFWKEYPGPRKVEKRRCHAKWREILLNANDPREIYQDIMCGLYRWQASDTWVRSNGAFISAPFAWLNRRRWNDYVYFARQEARMDQSTPPPPMTDKEIKEVNEMLQNPKGWIMSPEERAEMIAAAAWTPPPKPAKPDAARAKGKTKTYRRWKRRK